MTEKQFYDVALTEPTGGNLNLQIPQFDIDFQNPLLNKDYTEDLINFHPGWIIRLTFDGVPTIGKQSAGYLAWTTLGWKENKDKIKKVFESSPDKRGTWKKFEAAVKKHFDMVTKKTSKKIKNLEYALATLKKLKL